MPETRAPPCPDLAGTAQYQQQRAHLTSPIWCVAYPPQVSVVYPSDLPVFPHLEWCERWWAPQGLAASSARRRFPLGSCVQTVASGLHYLPSPTTRQVGVCLDGILPFFGAGQILMLQDGTRLELVSLCL